MGIVYLRTEDANTKILFGYWMRDMSARGFLRNMRRVK
jgi:hypothetical protein